MTEPWFEEVERWLHRRTVTSPPPPLEGLAAAQRASGERVTVCLPTLDEAATVAEICSRIRAGLVEAGVVEELLVVDSGSTDGTPDLAAAAGAKVHSTATILPGLDPGPTGKGEALWKSLAVAEGDIVVWIDADIRDFDPSFVTRLVAPLLADRGLAMTKGFYDRPQEGDGGGGRVTELSARPLLRLLYPRLSGVIQPLSGEYALRRAAALELPFVTGYGVDAALLIDLVHRRGLDALAQVDLGARVHRNRGLLELGGTAFEVMHAILQRLDGLGVVDLNESLPASLLQFEGGKTIPRLVRNSVAVRPPMAEVLEAGN